MGELVRFLRKRFVMKSSGRVWVERQVELILPAELEARA